MDNRQTAVGSLWRSVVNFLDGKELVPAIYMPLLEHVTGRDGSDGFFLDRVRETLAKPGDRSEVEDEIAIATVALRLWQEQSEAIYRWACGDADTQELEGSFTHRELENWWLYDDRKREFAMLGARRCRQFVEAVQLTPEDRKALALYLEDEDMLDILVVNLKKDLKWLDELRWLSDLAEVTWPADPKDRQPWSQGDVAFVDNYYIEQAPMLAVPDEEAEEIDPFTIRTVTDEQSIGFGLDGLSYCMFVLMRSVVIDFMNEILEHSKYPGARGSMRCTECGRYVERNPQGYGQLYCGDTCKKRAAKRRYRHRASSRGVLV